MASAAGYDGTIRINTAIDADGMNKGTKDIAKSTSASLGGLMGTIKKLALTVGFLFTTEKIISFVRTAIQSFDIMGSSFGAKITELKTSFEVLKGALVNALLSALTALMPYIMAAIDGFTRMLTVIAQVITVLSGAANAQNKLAGATNAANKAAKGALASFDQLNVLQKPTDAGTALLPDVPVVPQDLIDRVNALKQGFLDFIQPLSDVIQKISGWVMTEIVPRFFDILGISATILGQLITAAKPGLQWLWDNFLQPIAKWTGGVIIQALDWLLARLKDLSKWMTDNQETVAGIIKFLIIFGTVWLTLVTIFNIVMWVIGLVNVAIAFFTGEVFAAMLAVAPFVILLLAVIAAIALLIYFWPQVSAAFQDWIWIINRVWTDTWNGMPGLIKGTINVIIGYVENMAAAVTIAINGIIDSINAISQIGVPGFSIGLAVQHVTAPKIPRLATGAVIPPNAQFAAILGDQRSGTNIEAPADLIRSIVSEEIANMPMQKVSISFDGNLAELVRILGPVIKQEQQRTGGSLIKSIGSAT